MYAVQQAMTFPSDQPPAGFGPVHLEQHDVAMLLRSDSLANIIAGTNALSSPSLLPARRVSGLTLTVQ